MLPHKRFRQRSIQEQLMDCDNIEEMMEVLNNTYDLSKVRPGVIKKPLLVQGLLKLIKEFNPPER